MMTNNGRMKDKEMLKEVEYSITYNHFYHGQIEMLLITKISRKIKKKKRRKRKRIEFN